ncbi:MAG: hypothetical protein MSC30_02290 [Gaiellaceae bacterium MAG52_C11]|nr:hypothetical protein [Candidatus Gaiellasilicea maunaloa]
MEETVDRKLAQARSREPELLADTHGKQSDTARMTFGVGVLVSEEASQGADLRAEERLLGEDELGAAGSPARGREGAARSRSSARAPPAARTGT